MTHSPNCRPPARETSRGFTLIEILVVISIIAVLSVALLPAITDALSRGEEAETTARMIKLQALIDTFEGKYGFYPPDDFGNLQDAEVQIKARTDKVNAGIESLLMFLCWGEVDITENEDWLANTDLDENSVVIPMLDRKDKVELVDGWGTPFAYIHNRNYGKKFEIELLDGLDILSGTALRNPNSGKYMARNRYQLISAGGDVEFGTDDDLTHPARPQQ